MAANNLTGNSPASTRHQLLHLGTGTLALGARVRDGAGNQTPLEFPASGGMKCHDGPFEAPTVSVAGIAISRAGSTPRAVTLPDSAGRIAVDATTVLAADHSNSTISPTAVSGFTLALEASTTYEFEGILMCQSAALNTGVQPQLTGPIGQTELISYRFDTSNNAALNSNDDAIWMSAYNVPLGSTTAPTADVPFPVFVRGILRTTAFTPSAPLGISLRSSREATAVSLRAGSFLRIRKLA